MRRYRAIGFWGGIAAAALAALTLGATPLRADMEFIRGDVNGSRTTDMLDAVGILEYLFQGRTEVGHCLDAADADDDGRVAINDAIYVLVAVFARGPVPPPPFPTRGADPTGDGIDCRGWLGSSVEFFGERIPTGAIVYVIDRSGSMQDAGELAIAKREVSRSILALDDGMLFAVLFFDVDTIALPFAAADEASRGAAIEWVRGVGSDGGGSCPRAALLESLELAVEAPVSPVTVLFYSAADFFADRMDVCGETPGETIAAVAAANAGRVAIYTIGIQAEEGSPEEAFLRDLAERNGGDHVRVD